MANLPIWLTRTLAIPAAVGTCFAAAHSFRYRGLRPGLLFGALALGLPAVGEYAAIRSKSLRHHTQPQIGGVPVGAVLSWYIITYATFSTLESIWSRRGLTPRERRVLLPTSTAVVATSLDLVLDCMGLDLGMWEWTEDGPYAREIRGANGKRGIPLGNFKGWLILTGGVTLLYLLLTPEGVPPATGCARSGRQAAYLLLPYYLPAALWALWRHRPRYLLYSAVFPVVLWRALTARRAAGPPGSYGNL